MREALQARCLSLKKTEILAGTPFVPKILSRMGASTNPANPHRVEYLANDVNLFGLSLKRSRLSEPGERTLFTELPAVRATNDIDMSLRAEVLADLARTKEVANTITKFGYAVVEEAKYLQGKKPVMVGETEQYASPWSTNLAESRKTPNSLTFEFPWAKPHGPDHPRPS